MLSKITVIGERLTVKAQGTRHKAQERHKAQVTKAKKVQRTKIQETRSKIKDRSLKGQEEIVRKERKSRLHR